MRICESSDSSAQEVSVLQEGMLIGYVQQKGICELWRAVTLH